MYKKRFFILLILLSSNFLIGTEINHQTDPAIAPQELFDAIGNSKIKDQEVVKLLSEFFALGGSLSSKHEQVRIPLLISLIQNDRASVINRFIYSITKEMVNENFYGHPAIYWAATWGNSGKQTLDVIIDAGATVFTSADGTIFALKSNNLSNYKDNAPNYNLNELVKTRTDDEKKKEVIEYLESLAKRINESIETDRNKENKETQELKSLTESTMIGSCTIC